MKLLPKEVSLRQSDQTHKVGRCCTSFSRFADDKSRAKLTFLAHQRCLTVVPQTRFFFSLNDFLSLVKIKKYVYRYVVFSYVLYFVCILSIIIKKGEIP